jgi:FMN phosphatase YigB (HAD superfamily)
MIDPNKVILVDCDGVLLDWEYSFGRWMERHGYKVAKEGEYKMNIKYGIDKAESKKLCRMFNESANIRKIPPLRDAIKYIRKLHEEHGYVFHAITSLSDDQYAQHLRTKNLRELFGNTAFEEYIYLDTGADKDEVLERYRGSNCFWVEDKPENADVGFDCGLNSILMAHEHNAYYDGAALRVSNWKEIYGKIVGEY